MTLVIIVVTVVKEAVFYFDFVGIKGGTTEIVIESPY